MISEIPDRFFYELQDPKCTKHNGRIGASLSQTDPKRGYIGFFEASDFHAAKFLIDTATAWLKDHGVSKIYGPINFTTWFSYRFQMAPEIGQAVSTDDLKIPQFHFEPAHPPEYPIWFQEYGFRVAETYHSDGLEGIYGIIDDTRKDYERSISSGYSFRTWNAQTLMEKEVPILYQLSVFGFKNNFLFESIPFELFRDLYVPLLDSKVDLKLSYFALDSNGKEVGFFFNFIDQQYFIMKTVAVLPEFRGRGLSNAMLHLAASEASRRGIDRVMAALVRDGNQSESYSRKQKLLWKKKYALFQLDVN
jgi:GNAT superfamily N-acetyltransferase